MLLVLLIHDGMILLVHVFQSAEGVQIFFEFVDDDFSSNDLIDRFAINVTLPVGTTTERETYSGIFGLATVNISFTLECAENFYDANCDRLPDNTGSTVETTLSTFIDTAMVYRRNISLVIAGVVILTLLSVITLSIMVVCSRIRKHRKAKSVGFHDESQTELTVVEPSAKNR